MTTKKIIVVPYCSDWPIIFEREASEIKEVLGSNCLNLYHVGSTSVPGLSAKPVIDIIGVVKNPKEAIRPLEGLSFKYKGEVRDEFFLIGSKIKQTLKILFKPDKMNYAALSNTSPVIHMHIIPRYKEPRQFNGITFRDARWGQNYAPYDRSFVLDEPTLFKIRDAIKEHL